jgi:alpha-L-rhamnosidase
MNMIKAVNLKCEYMNNPLGIDVLSPRLSWELESEVKAQKQTAYQIIVSSSSDKLEKNQADIWDTGKVESNQTAQISYLGKILKTGMRCWWKVRVWDKDGEASDYSEPAWWEMGIVDAGDWKAKWIGLDPQYTPKDPEAPEYVGQPCPYMRKNFNINNKVVKARVYAAALGVYEIYINGVRVGEDVFSPGWTDYHKRIQYQTYDVTGLIAEGSNTVGAVLGDGWYAGNVAIAGRHRYGDYPLKLYMQMEIEYSNGTKKSIITDGSWKGSKGPLIYSDMLMGEMYDARREMDGWCTPEFDDSTWNAVNELKGTGGVFNAQTGPVVKRISTLNPVSVSSPEEGVFIFDMGQNMVGRVRLRIKGEAGDRITLRFGEMLKDDGTLYTENLRSAKQTDTYILKGGEEEVYEPVFTFHGFRFVELSGYPGKPGLDVLTAIVIHSDLLRTGWFECSNTMLNKLFSNILWGQKGNFLSIPTDCPQRDERMGWTGDGQIFAQTACFNMECAAFYAKWMKDIMDAQMPSGSVTDVAPPLKRQNGNDLTGNGHAAWGDAVAIIPWTVYKFYGDVRILETSYNSIEGWVKYLKDNSDGLLRPDSGYGDWLNVNSETPKDVISTAYFAHSTNLLSKIAGVLGKMEDSLKYQRLFEQIKTAFNQAYVTDDCKIKGDTQTCYLLALSMDLLPKDRRPLAVKHLLRTIEEKDCHLSTGFVGVRFLLPELTEAGFADIAYRLVTNDTYPSWGYSIKNGATTIWERWNSYTREEGFGDVGMNSFNHYSLGSCGEWLYQYAAGISTDENVPGFERFVIKPYLGGGLSYAKARYHSIHGMIKSHWTAGEEGFTLKVAIPVNTEAEIHIPCADNGVVTVDGMSLEQAEGIHSFERKAGYVVVKAGSGEYNFTNNFRFK